MPLMFFSLIILRKEDFSNNTYVIFRGSSIIFDAIRSGLIPIYLNKGVNINILDLFELFNYNINFDSLLNNFSLKILSLDSDTANKFANLFYPAKYERLLNEIKTMKTLKMLLL